jgi:hypothetical protein
MVTSSAAQLLDWTNPPPPIRHSPLTPSLMLRGRDGPASSQLLGKAGEEPVSPRRNSPTFSLCRPFMLSTPKVPFRERYVAASPVTTSCRTELSR